MKKHVKTVHGVSADAEDAVMAAAAAAASNHGNISHGNAGSHGNGWAVMTSAATSLQPQAVDMSSGR